MTVFRIGQYENQKALGLDDDLDLDPPVVKKNTSRRSQYRVKLKRSHKREKRKLWRRQYTS
jgi:hypothetical protein